MTVLLLASLLGLLFVSFFSVTVITWLDEILHEHVPCHPQEPY